MFLVEKGCPTFEYIFKKFPFNNKVSEIFLLFSYCNVEKEKKRIFPAAN